MAEVLSKGKPSTDDSNVSVSGDSFAKKAKDYITGDAGSTKNIWNKDFPSKTGNMVEKMSAKEAGSINVNGNFYGK